MAKNALTVAFVTSRFRVGCQYPSKAQDGRSDMSIQDFLTLVVTAALIVLSAAVHSPFAESLAPVLTIAVPQ
jgi:hypothetical protein